jgi:hypothetical protein
LVTEAQALRTAASSLSRGQERARNEHPEQEAADVREERHAATVRAGRGSPSLPKIARNYWTPAFAAASM